MKFDDVARKVTHINNEPLDPDKIYEVACLYEPLVGLDNINAVSEKMACEKDSYHKSLRTVGQKLFGQTVGKFSDGWSENFRMYSWKLFGRTVGKFADRQTRRLRRRGLAFDRGWPGFGRIGRPASIK